MTEPSDRSAIELLEASHTREAIRARLEAGPSHSDLRDFIFGAIDGTVTTFAVVSGVSGAGLSAGILIILGVANLIADGYRSRWSIHGRSWGEVRREEMRDIRLSGYCQTDVPDSTRYQCLAV